MASKLQKEFVLKYTTNEDQGKVGVVTGANSGIGYEAARMLASRGMQVVMACRNIEKAELARSMIIADNPKASVVVLQLDLASLKSVRAFSDLFNSKFNKLDLLVNNGGVMVGPHRLTEDGFEMLLGTNHLGHFALTALLMDSLIKVPGARVVTISSIAHFKGVINFDDLQSLQGYSRKACYRQSKLANLMFAYELDRRLKEAGKDVISVAVHPGITSTNILKLPYLIKKLKEMVLMNTLKGALPTMMGSVDPGIKGGEFIGPNGYGQLYGYPAILKSGDHSHNKDIWSRLWKVSEELTGVRFKI